MQGQYFVVPSRYAARTICGPVVKTERSLSLEAITARCWSSRLDGFPPRGAAPRAVVRARFLSGLLVSVSARSLGMAAVATWSCRWRPPFEKRSFLPCEVGRTRGQFVLDGRAASTVVITGTRRGFDCSGFLTWTSSAPLA